MPTIDTLDGIDINVYNGDNNPPHIHAIYNEYEVRINIKTGKQLLGGSMPKGQLRKIEKWLNNKDNKDLAILVFMTLNPRLRK